MESKQVIFWLVVAVIALLLLLLIIFWDKLLIKKDTASYEYNPPVEEISPYTEQERILGESLQMMSKIQEEEYYLRQAMLNEALNQSRSSYRSKSNNGRKEADGYDW